MKKIIASIVLSLTLFIHIGAMEPETPPTEKNLLSLAIQDRNLESVFTCMNQEANATFFKSLNLTEQYWLLLATFDYELRDNPEHSDTCAQILLNNMYTMFGYEDQDTFHQELQKASPSCFVQLLAERNVHETITCACTNGLENILSVVLAMHNLLIKKCNTGQYRSLMPLRTAIKNGHAEIIKIILGTWIPFMIKTNPESAQDIWNTVGETFVFSVDHMITHPKHFYCVDIFLEMDEITLNLPLTALQHLYNKTDYIKHAHAIDCIEKKKQKEPPLSHSGAIKRNKIDSKLEDCTMPQGTNAVIPGDTVTAQVSNTSDEENCCPCGGCSVI